MSDLPNKSIFHVHTKRCGHASDDHDEEYIKKAIELGAQSITFTDHAPFPGNPFGNRMRYEQLDEYVRSLHALREKYKEQILVRIGLEIEFLPSYLKYYQELKRSGNFDLLMLGQHFYEIGAERYSFSLAKNAKNEYAGFTNAIVEAINTGMFDIVAHPDRIFKYQKSWTPKIEECSNKIIDAAKHQGVLLEQNESSKTQTQQYWQEFWNIVPSEMKIIGLDAHSVEELKLLK